LVAQPDDADYDLASILEGDAESSESGCSHVLLTEQPEQEVLGADVVVPESTRLVLGGTRTFRA